MHALSLETRPPDYVRCAPHSLFQGKPRFIPRALYIVIGWINDIAFNLDVAYCRLFKKHLYTKEFEDNTTTKLAIFCHGLRGHPSIWSRTMETFKKEFGTSVSYYTPRVQKRGNSALKETVQPILDRTIKWIQQDPARADGKIYLAGFSNGGRIAARVAYQLNRLYPFLHISTSCLATPINGSRLVADPRTPKLLQNIWKWLMQSRLFGSLEKELFIELTPGSEKAKELQSNITSAQARGVDFELYTSWGDFMVTPDTALLQTRPQIPCYRFKYRGHYSTVPAARTQQLQTAKQLFD